MLVRMPNGTCFMFFPSGFVAPREHPARTVCAAGAISGVTSWNDVDSAPPPSTALGVTLDADTEDGVKRWSGYAVRWNRR